MRRAARNTEANGRVIPDDRAKKASEQDVLIHEMKINEAFAHGGGDGGAKGEWGDEVPSRGPDDGPKWAQDTRGNDGGDGTGGVVPAIGEIECQADENDDDEEMETVHALCAP